MGGDGGEGGSYVYGSGSGSGVYRRIILDQIGYIELLRRHHP